MYIYPTGSYMVHVVSKHSKLIYNLHTLAEDTGMNQKWGKLSSHFVNCVSWTNAQIKHLDTNDFTYTD